ncbi:MAG: tetratricopeptide repeat protein, partial [Anaerolineales bacterium]
MHTDQAVLSALAEQLAPEALAAVLSRVLRVPEAWDALHNPGFLAEVLAAHPGPQLTPSQLGSLALGGTLAEPIQLALAEPHRGRAELIWQEADLRSGSSRDLFEVTLLGLEFAQRMAGSGDSASLIGRASQTPEIWMSPLAVAWPALPDPDQLLARMIQADCAELAIRLVLSSLPTAEAGAALIRNAGGSSLRLIQAIQECGAPGLAVEIPDPGQFRLAGPLLDPIAKAVGARPDGDHESVHRTLSQAWQAATETAALVADLTAAHARTDFDPVTELEALQRALGLHATPARRAWAALCQMKLSRFGEAIDTLPRGPRSIEEQIAQGLVLMQHGESGDSELRAALAGLGTGTRLNQAWYELLASGLWSSGDRTSAIEAASKRLRRFPANSAARTDFARLLFEAGDSEASREQSALALALSPSSGEARHTLATSLQDLGQYPEALSHWKVLSDEGAGDPEALIEAALRAGDMDTASAVVTKQLEQDPNSRTARIVEGRILAVGGNPVSGKEKIAAAIEGGQQEAGPYLALAALQAESGDPLEVGETLTRGALADPESAEIRVALAKWLSAQGRQSEALETATSAIAIEADNLEAVLVQADLLRQLGHVDQSVASLRQTARLKPLSWRVGLALAEALVGRGELEEAASLAASVPSSAPPESLLIAGKVGVMAGIRVEKALKALSEADAAGLTSPDLDFWFARALEADGQFEPALKRFERALSRLPEELVQQRELASLGMARSALGSGQISVALSTLESALEWFRGSTEILALMSEIYQAANLPEKAIGVARQAVDCNRDSATGWRALGKALGSSGEFEAAVQALEQLSSRDPSNSAGWLELAEVALDHGKQSVGRRAVAEAAWRSRRRPEVLARLASLLAKNDARPTALRFLRAGLLTRPEDVRLRRQLAQLKEDSGDHKGALEAWLSSAEVEPHEPSPLVRGASVAGKMGDYPQALELLERAVGLAPRNASARRELARAYLQLGRIEPGFAAYEAAVKELPGDSALVMEVAEAALLAGALERIDPLIDRARQAVVEPARIQAVLGEAYLARNRWDEAKQALEEAVAAGEASARVFAMLAILASRTDLSQAKESLVRASQATSKSIQDAIWISRGQLRLLNWNAALAALEPWVANPYAARERARVLLRSANAGWLFNSVDARASAPGVDEQESISAAEALIKDLAHLGLADSALQPLRSLREAGSGALRSAQVADQPQPDPAGQLAEAVAIGLLKAGKPSQALEVLAQAPDSEWAPLLVGLAHERAGNPAAARAGYRRCAEDPVLGPLGDFLLGRSYARARRPELATSHLNAAVTAWPAEHAWQHALGLHYADLNDLDASLVHLQQAVAIDGLNPTYRLDLARVLRRTGQLAPAEEALSSVLQTRTDSSEVWREAAETALELGKLEKAADRFE